MQSDFKLLSIPFCKEKNPIDVSPKESIKTIYILLLTFLYGLSSIFMYFNLHSLECIVVVLT